MTISYKPPISAVNETCQVCGSTVFCGGVLCPNKGLLPNSPDGVSQVSTTYVSVAVRNPNPPPSYTPQVG